MPKRINDDQDDELTGMDSGDRPGATEAGRSAEEWSDERAGDERAPFDPSSQGDESGEVL